MENTVNKRILMLKTELSLNDIEFCGRASISTASLYKIKNDEEMSQRVLNSIISGFNVNKDWLLTGKGKMFTDMPKETTASNPWKDALISELKEEVTYYRELLKMMAGGKAANFLNAIENTRFTKKYLPSKSFNSVRAVA